MNSFELMCNDPEKARLNQERVARGQNAEYYAHEKAALFGIDIGKLPSNIKVGQLPQIHPDIAKYFREWR